jgi:hypothetical protein
MAKNHFSEGNLALSDEPISHAEAVDSNTQKALDRLAGSFLRKVEDFFSTIENAISIGSGAAENGTRKTLEECAESLSRWRRQTLPLSVADIPLEILDPNRGHASIPPKNSAALVERLQPALHRYGVALAVSEFAAETYRRLARIRSLIQRGELRIETIQSRISELERQFDEVAIDENLKSKKCTFELKALIDAEGSMQEELKLNKVRLEQEKQEEPFYAESLQKLLVLAKRLCFDFTEAPLGSAFDYPEVSALAEQQFSIHDRSLERGLLGILSRPAPLPRGTGSVFLESEDESRVISKKRSRIGSRIRSLFALLLAMGYGEIVPNAHMENNSLHLENFSSPTSFPYSLDKAANPSAPTCDSASESQSPLEVSKQRFSEFLKDQRLLTPSLSDFIAKAKKSDDLDNIALDHVEPILSSVDQCNSSATLFNLNPKFMEALRTIHGLELSSIFDFFMSTKNSSDRNFPIETVCADPNLKFNIIVFDDNKKFITQVSFSSPKMQRTACR